MWYRLVRAPRIHHIAFRPVQYPFTSTVLPKRFYTMSEAPAAPEGPSKSELKKQAKAAEKEAKRIEREKKESEAKAAREANDTDFAAQNYGFLPLNQSQEATGRKRNTIASLAGGSQTGQRVLFRARLHKSRSQSAKLAFFEFRHQVNTIQALMAVDTEDVSKQMVKWAIGLARETIVLVEGVVQQPKELVKSTTVQDAEVKILRLHVEAEVQTLPPISVEDASRPPISETGEPKEGNQLVSVKMDKHLENRVMSLRTPISQSIFRISSATCNLFREYLNGQGFIEIHTPKLQGAATESGSSVFQIDYFKRPAYLAQSPQLAKQACIAADMEKVYEIAPVFRAENSNTARHMTEFTGLDLEMAFNESYDEVVKVIDGMLKFIFKNIQEKYSQEIRMVATAFPSEPFKFLEATPRLKFPEAVQMLKEHGMEQKPLEDLNTENEKFLGKLVKEKYGTDYYILDKFPTAARPFYTMPDPQDPNYSNSYDFFMRGEEILSGAQRIHVADKLIENMKVANIVPESMQDYIDGFKWGAPPHAGGGIGLERIVMLYLNLGNIRWATLFPRDPKSFPTAEMLEAEAKEGQS